MKSVCEGGRRGGKGQEGDTCANNLRELHLCDEVAGHSLDVLRYSTKERHFVSNSKMP